MECASGSEVTTIKASRALLVALLACGTPAIGAAKEQPPGTIRISSVGYSGTTFRAVRKDDDSADYDAPHWQDLSNPPDGDAVDPDDREFPVSFVREGKVVVAGTWFVDPPAVFQNSQIRGKGVAALNMTVPATAAALSGNTLSITDVTMTGKLPATVKFINKFTIDWEVSVDGGQTWFPAGASGNRFYVALAPAIAGARPFETVLEIGARNADGESHASGVVAKLWRDFTNPASGVKRKAQDGFNRPDGKNMTYWLNPAQACTTMQEMISKPEGDGKCDAWGRLLQQTIQNLGIDGSKLIKVTALHSNDGNLSLPNIPAGDTRGGMLVKNWTIVNAPAAPPACQPFTRVLGAGALMDNTGVPGQGNPNPVSTFVEHFIVEYAGSFFDPSYGGTAYGSQQAWEDASIDFFVKMCAPPQAAAVAVFKANSPAVETVFTPQP